MAERVGLEPNTSEGASRLEGGPGTLAGSRSTWRWVKESNLDLFGQSGFRRLPIIDTTRQERRAAQAIRLS
jgi:hypothetical protein